MLPLVDFEVLDWSVVEEGPVKVEGPVVVLVGPCDDDVEVTTPDDETEVAAPDVDVEGAPVPEVLAGEGQTFCLGFKSKPPTHTSSSIT